MLVGYKPTDQENPHHIILYPSEYFTEGKVKVVGLLDRKRRLRGNLFTPSLVASGSEHTYAPYSLQSSVYFLQRSRQSLWLSDLFFCFLIGCLPF